MEKSDIRLKVLRTLGKEINHLDDVRLLLINLGLSKQKVKRVYLLQDLLKSLAFELYLSMNKEDVNVNKCCGSVHNSDDNC